MPALNKQAVNNKNNKEKKVKKLLVLAAVILFVCFFGKGFIQSSEKLGQANKINGSDQLVAGEKAPGSTTIPSEAGILGGPLAGLEQILFNSAQGAVDFSADDEEENSDLVFVQENSLMGSNSPSPSDGNLFSKFRKDVITHIVKSGDNPEKIGISFGINTDTILWANNLKDGDLIRPGDKLLILPINGIRVKISSKDNINALAKKYQGKADEIIAFNSLSADGGLKAGEYIIIPGGEKPVEIIPGAKQKILKPSAPKYASSMQKADSWLIIPTTGRVWGRVHSYNGVDIANDCGTPIYAAAAGRVILSDASGWNSGYGKYIKIQHPNGVITLYGHASQLLVNEGEQISQGELIAHVGTTGRSTGCHLHFEVRGAKNPLTR